VEKTGQEILIDYIKEDTQDSEKSMQNLIFKDDFSKEDEEKISQKAAELLAFLSDLFLESDFQFHYLQL